MAGTILGRGGSRPGETYYTKTTVPKTPIAPKLTNTNTARNTAQNTAPTTANTRPSRIPTGDEVKETARPSWIPTDDNSSGGSTRSSASDDYKNIVNAINAEKQRQTDLMLSNIKAAYDEQEKDYEAEIPTIQQDASTMRNKVDTGYYQALPELYRAMEMGGQRGGENITGMVGLNTTRQEGQNQANLYEANQIQNIRNAISGLGEQRIQAETSAQAGIESDAFSNILSAMKDSAAQTKSDLATAKNDFENTIGAYSDNYQAEINRLNNLMSQGITTDNGVSIAYKISMLNAARNQKKAEQEAAEAEAAQNADQSAQAWARIYKTGGTGTTSDTLSYEDAFQLYQQGVRSPAVLKALGLQ